MTIIRAAALLIAGVAAGALITHYSMSTEQHSVEAVHVIEVQAPDAMPPSTYLGENDPIVPLVCGVNLNCSQVDRQIAAQKAPKTLKAKSAANSAPTTTNTTTKSVRTSTSKSGAHSTTVTTTHTTKH